MKEISSFQYTIDHTLQSCLASVYWFDCIYKCKQNEKIETKQHEQKK